MIMNPLNTILNFQLSFIMTSKGFPTSRFTFPESILDTIIPCRKRISISEVRNFCCYREVMPFWKKTVKIQNIFFLIRGSSLLKLLAANLLMSIMSRCCQMAHRIRDINIKWKWLLRGGGRERESFVYILADLRGFSL